MSSFNHALFLLINANTGSAASMIELARLIATYAAGIVPILLCWDWLRGESAGRLDALAIFGTILLALGLNQVIGFFVFMPRPFAIPLGHSFLVSATDTSFPSDHATVLFGWVFATLLEKHWGRAVTMAVIAVAVSWSRVYLGVHLPLDILGAAGVSLAAALLCKWLMKAMGEPILHIAQTIYRTVLGPLIRTGWVRP